MIEKGVYRNRWPSRLDLEELLYRPLLLNWLPGLFGRLCGLFGENRLTAPLFRGLVSILEKAAGLFGENRVTTPVSRGLFRLTKTVSHAASDSLDALVLVLSRTVFRQSQIRSDDKVTGSVPYRLGARMDAAAQRLGRRQRSRDQMAGTLYRWVRTFRLTSRRIMGNVSFALLMLVLAICVVFLYMMLRPGL